MVTLMLPQTFTITPSTKDGTKLNGMKKSYLLILTACFTLGLMSCEKLMLKEETTIQLDFSHAESSFQYNDDGAVNYLNELDLDQWMAEYSQDLQDHLGTGKIDIVQSGAEYTLRLDVVTLTETVERARELGRTYELSTLTLNTQLTLVHNREDIPTYMEIETSRSEDIHCPESGDIDAIDMDDVFCDNFAKTKNKVKKVLKRNQ
jgi:hypothetical protein